MMAPGLHKDDRIKRPHKDETQYFEGLDAESLTGMLMGVYDFEFISWVARLFSPPTPVAVLWFAE
jgi:hypothetical protein